MSDASCPAPQLGWGAHSTSSAQTTSPGPHHPFRPSTNPWGRQRARAPRPGCRGPAGTPPRNGTGGTLSSLLRTLATRAPVLRGTLVLVSRILRAGGLWGEEGPRCQGWGQSQTPLHPDTEEKVEAQEGDSKGLEGKRGEQGAPAASRSCNSAPAPRQTDTFLWLVTYPLDFSGAPTTG